MPLIGIIYGVSILFGVLMWVSGWPAYASADTGGVYRFDGSKSQHTGSIVGRVRLVGAYEKPTRLKVFKNGISAAPGLPMKVCVSAVMGESRIPS